MTTTVLGATGRTGSAVVQRLLDDPAAVAAGLKGTDTAFVALGSIGLDLTGHEPRTLDAFLHENHALFR